MWNTSWQIILGKVQNLKIWKKTYNCWGMSHQISWILGLTSIMMICSLLYPCCQASIEFISCKIKIYQLCAIPQERRELPFKMIFFFFFPMTTTVVTTKIALNWEVFQVCCCLQHPPNLKTANSPNEEEVPLTSSCFSKQESVWCLACQ